MGDRGVGMVVVGVTMVCERVLIVPMCVIAIARLALLSTVTYNWQHACKNRILFCAPKCCQTVQPSRCPRIFNGLWNIWYLAKIAFNGLFLIREKFRR